MKLINELVFLSIILFFLKIFLSNFKENFNYIKSSLPINTKVFNDNCLEICNDNTFCEEFNKKKENYNKCINCNKKGYCFKKFNTNNSLCVPCIKGEKYTNNCNSVFNDACPPLNNIYNFNGVEPYFKLIKDNNIYNPYNTKCLKCNNLI